MTVTQYDAIGRSYERMKTQMPLARHPEGATFAELIAGHRGGQVLDLACGTGWYSRVLGRTGGFEVTGVDISQEMVDVACSIEAAAPTGARFLRADVQELSGIGRFDLVTAVWLLCYAGTQAELTDMARAARRNLGPGGTYVGIEMNPAFDWGGPHATAYGLTHEVLRSFDGGKGLSVVAHVDPVITFEATFWEEAPIVEAFRVAGFRTVEFVDPVLPRAAVEEFGEPFWADFRANPTIRGIRAVV